MSTCSYTQGGLNSIILSRKLILTVRVRNMGHPMPCVWYACLTVNCKPIHVFTLNTHNTHVYVPTSISVTKWFPYPIFIFYKARYWEAPSTTSMSYLHVFARFLWKISQLLSNHIIPTNKTPSLLIHLSKSLLINESYLEIRLMFA